MISIRRGAGALAATIVIAATSSAFTTGNSRDNTGTSEVDAELTCLNCVFYNGMHKFMTETPQLCEGEENCENNNCRACGDESDCHQEPRQGPCHVECDCGVHQNEIEADAVPELDAALAAADVERLATLITQRQSVEFNKERQAVQVYRCSRVVRQASLNAAQVSDLEEAILRLNLAGH